MIVSRKGEKGVDAPRGYREEKMEYVLKGKLSLEDFCNFRKHNFKYNKGSENWEYNSSIITCFNYLCYVFFNI